MSHTYPLPTNEDSFEELCLRLYRKLWKNEALQLYGKRGESQNGIDIFDPIARKPICAVQCKFHEPHKTISPASIREEVKKAESSPHELDLFVIATSAKKSRNAQDAVAHLNQRASRSFTVEIHFWEDICLRCSELGKVIAELIVYGENILAGATTARIPIEPRALFVDETTIEGRFAELERLFEDRKLEAFEHELAKLDSAQLETDDQYRFLRLKGKLAVDQEQYGEAGDFFLAAFDLKPELAQAKENRALGYWLKADYQRAYEIARGYIEEGSVSANLLSQVVRNATTIDQALEYESKFAEFVGTDENLNLTIYHKLNELDRAETAAEYAKRAHDISGGSAHASYALGTVFHNRALEVNSNADRLECLLSALENYDRAHVLASDKRYLALIPEILIHRASIKFLRQDLAGAKSDYYLAIDSRPRPNECVQRVVSFHLHIGEYAEAWELLNDLPANDLESEFLTTATEYFNADSPTKRQHIAAMLRLANVDWKRSVECRFHAVQWAIESRDSELATQVVTDEFAARCPFQASTLRAWIALERGDIDSAKSLAQEALEQGIGEAEADEVRLLARGLCRLGEDAKAIPLLEQLAVNGVLNDDMNSLLSCAEKSQRHDLIIRLCRELREGETQNEELRKLELDVLSAFAPDKAFELVDDFQSASSQPSYFLAVKNWLAVRLRRVDDVRIDEAKLPRPTDLPCEQSQFVTLPYVAIGRFREAVEFLYGQLRAYFDREIAHGQYIFMFVQYGHKLGFPVTLEEVDSNSAVLLAEDDGGNERWVVLEDNSPIPSRGEHMSTSRIGRLLLGKKVGDAILEPGEYVQSRTLVVQAVLSKYVRAFQDCLADLSIRFPGTSLAQQVDLGGKGDELDVTPIIQSLEKRKEDVEHCFGVYADQPCSIYLLAKRLGLTELETTKSLAEHPGGFVRCCDTSPDQFGALVTQDMREDAIVLDLSAIVTLSLTDGWHLVQTDRNYLVSQRTIEVVDSWVHDAENAGRTAGFTSLSPDGRLQIIENTEEHEKAKLNELKNIKQRIDEFCTIKSSTTLAGLDLEKQELYEAVVGFHNAEAMCLAEDEGGTLWTDDMVLGFLASSDFGVERIWTQLMLMKFVAAGSVSASDFDAISAKLAGLQYSQTIWNGGTLLAAAKLANWDANAWPFTEFRRLLEESPLPVPARARLVLEFLKQLRRSDCIELRQSGLIQPLLDALGSIAAVRWLLRTIDVHFGIDVYSAEFVRMELQLWMRPRM